MKKMLFIYNPHAGKALIKNKLSDIIELFVGAGYEITIFSTKQQKDATNIVIEKGEQFDIIVCSGGDGTLNEVTDGLMALTNRPPCGYIPAGTINDFASSLNLSKNMVKAAQTIINGTLFPYDIGSLNDDYFTYIAAFGAFTDVAYDTPQTSKNILGKLAYFLEGVKRVPNLPTYHLIIEFQQNGEDIKVEDDFIYGMITNSNSVGGFKGLAGKDVKLDDGFFEVVLIKNPKNIIELQKIVNALITKELDNEYMYSFLAKEILLYCEIELPWTVDGEFGGKYKTSIVKNYKQAITYIKEKIVPSVSLQ